MEFRISLYKDPGSQVEELPEILQDSGGGTVSTDMSFSSLEDGMSATVNPAKV